VRTALAVLILAALAWGGFALLRARGAEADSQKVAAADGTVTLPSGRNVTFLDTIWGQPGEAGLAVRFRFVEPDLATWLDKLDYDSQEADMAFLCNTYALDRIANTGPRPSQVIVSISDRPTEFGAADPDARQVFEAYRPENGKCIWEGF
jgi:hypothetical protein